MVETYHMFYNESVIYLPLTCYDSTNILSSILVFFLSYNPGQGLDRRELRTALLARVFFSKVKRLYF